MGRFNKGFFLGAAAGAVVAWLTQTKEGKAKKEQIIRAASKAYGEAEERVTATSWWKKAKRRIQ